MQNRPLKVAIVCDWLVGIGGAERVVLELHKLYPDAPIYTSQYDPKKIDWFKDADIRTTWLQYVPSSLKKFLPVLRAIAFRRLNLSNYDLVISSTGAEAKAVRTGPKTFHICYCHSPTQYYWTRYEEYLAQPGFPLGFNWLAKLGLKIFVGPLKKLDYSAAQKPTIMIANSTFTQAMIKKYYNRPSEIIFPPIDIERFKLDKPKKRQGFVVVGRQTPYKRIDLAITACTKLNLPLTVIGNGPEHSKLVKLAGESIIFRTDATDATVMDIVRSAKALIFPTFYEDFGIVPIEALALGTPVIAFKGGGVLDYIKPGVNGLFFEESNANSLVAVLKNFDQNHFNSRDIQVSARRFLSQIFRRKIQNLIAQI